MDNQNIKAQETMENETSLQNELETLDDMASRLDRENIYLYSKLKNCNKKILLCSEIMNLKSYDKLQKILEYYLYICDKRLVECEKYNNFHLEPR